MSIDDLDKWFPPCGPCAFCGHPDKRHRLWDALMERFDTGETIEEIATDYGYSVEAVKGVIRLQPYRELHGNR